jgi:hypothetical protein
MIWTNETPAAVTLTLIADLRPTMPANVVKGSNRIFGFADDNDAFASNVPQKIVAYARDLLCPARDYPMIEEKCFEIFAKQFGVEIIPRR